MAQQFKGQKCGFCVEKTMIQGRLTIQRFGRKGYQHELHLCSSCYHALSQMLCDLMRTILTRETAKLKQQMAGLKIG